MYPSVEYQDSNYPFIEADIKITFSNVQCHANWQSATTRKSRCQILLNIFIAFITSKIGNIMQHTKMRLFCMKEAYCQSKRQCISGLSLRPMAEYRCISVIEMNGLKSCPVFARKQVLVWRHTCWVIEIRIIRFRMMEFFA